MNYDVIVIGAGASGIMAAITAAKEGASVLLLEHKDSIGKKILATGNGRCNFTNEDMSLVHFRGDKRLIDCVLPQFDGQRTLAFFREIGILPRNKNGYYYPNSEQAASVLTALTHELQRLSVTVVTSVELLGVQKQKKFFVVRMNGQTHQARSVIWATGLLASPKLGSDGSSIPVLKELGHRFRPIVPALCAFYAQGTDFRRISGVRVQAALQLEIDQKFVASDTGELQLTDYGVSGIPVFQISRYASYGLYNRQSVILHINFMPDFDRQQLVEELNARIAHFADAATIARVCNGLFPQKLVSAISRRSGFSEDFVLVEADSAGILKLTDAITDFTVTLTRPRDYDFAQVCAGGITSEEVEPDTLQSKIVDHLFFAGEILDVDGICGGYNLQWAWSSGYTAGIHAARRGQ